jgi:CHAD domain-containing protein
MLEEERKYDVDARFAMPDLTSCLPSGGRLIVKPPLTLRATYYDTPDLALARSGASLRHRKGDDEPWTVKLPTATPGIRNEISAPGGSSAIPDDLAWLVAGWVREASLAPVVVLGTVRRAYQLLSADDEILAEVVDDAVSVLDGRKVRLKFREVEVERKKGRTKLLNRIDKVLRPAGAVPGEFTPKYVRALGPAAGQPPDWPSLQPLGSGPSAGAVVSTALRRDVLRIVQHDPLVRLRATVGEDDTAVHQMRVGCRRLRSDLRTFAPLLDPTWTAGLRAELGWLAQALGAAREAEVLRSRLRRTAADDPLVPLDKAAIARIDADLAARHEEALHGLDEVMRSDRYRALLIRFLDAATAPTLTNRAGEPAPSLLPKLVGKPWRRLAFGRADEPGAADLNESAADETWHGVRILAKRARYAADAVAGILGGVAAELAGALGQVQELLGEHQDAAVAANTWLDIAKADPDDHALAITAGRLFERERASIRTVRAAFIPAWRRASRRRLTEWLR